VVLGAYETAAGNKRTAVIFLEDGMAETWVPSLVLVFGLACGPALAAYSGWMIRCRRGELTGKMSPAALMVISLVNGIGWVLAQCISPTVPGAINLGLMVSAAVVFTAIDGSIRIIPNELVAALLALSAALALLEQGLGALPGRVVGFLVALTLFLVAMWIAGPGKVGGGDVKLAAVVGFAAGFPGVLVAILIMALAAVATGAAGMVLKKMGRTTPMPFAGFLMAGLVLTMILDRAGALGFLK
jgi:prepilin signal peptidase PulO-like enzyme (type II secretory pathway)